MSGRLSRRAGRSDRAETERGGQAKSRAQFSNVKNLRFRTENVFIFSFVKKRLYYS